MRGVFLRILFSVLSLNIVIITVCNSYLINTFGRIKTNNYYNNIRNHNYFKNISVNNNVYNNNNTNLSNFKYILELKSTSDDTTLNIDENNSSNVDLLDNNRELDNNVEYHKLNDYMGSSFLQYALSIILGRALPDSRDGLKVVHRRILWAMNILKLNPNGQYRKCAKVVGDVLGNYHPHSDKSVYDALCRLCQDFIMRMTLIDGHGNFGTNNDPPAAMRYTECRLTNYSKSLLLDDINLNTVDFIPNFDNTHIEPLVLPCRIPNLLINGSSGIAVGLATNIPPHNPVEIINSAIYLARNNGVINDEDELLEFVKGPDFPTGGIIRTTPDNMKKLYKTGKGTILLQSKYTFEEKYKFNNKEITSSYNNYNDLKFKIGSRISIIITEIPYNIKISDIILSINKNIKNNNIHGINDIKDESDRNGIRIVIELKRHISSKIEIEEILNKLNNLTELSNYFKCNFIALDSKGVKPIRFNLLNSLSIWLQFRIETLKRKYKYLLKITNYNLNVIKGYIIIINNLQEVIKLIKDYYKNNSNTNLLGGNSDTKDNSTSSTTSTPSEDNKVNEENLYKLLNEKYGLDNTQIKYIMRMTLKQLSKLNEEKLTERKNRLESQIVEYGKLLSDDKFLYKEIVEDLNSILNSVKFNKRMTEIYQINSGNIDKEFDNSNNDNMFSSTNTNMNNSSDSKDNSTISTTSSEGNVNYYSEAQNMDNESSGSSSDLENNNVIVYNNMGYVSKIKLDNKFYKSNKNKLIKSKLLNTTDTTNVNEINYICSNNDNNLLVFTRSSSPMRKSPKDKNLEEDNNSSKGNNNNYHNSTSSYNNIMTNRNNNSYNTMNNNNSNMNNTNYKENNSRDNNYSSSYNEYIYLDVNNNNIELTNNTTNNLYNIYNVNNNKLKLCKKGYNIFKHLQIKPIQQQLLYIINYNPPLKNILLVGYNDGIISLYNNTNNKFKIKKNLLKLKLLSNLKDKYVKFFMNFNQQDVDNKHLFITTKLGQCVKINIKDIVNNLIEGNKSRKNIKIMRLNPNDEVSASCLSKDDDHILILTNIGKFKLISSNEIRLQNIKGKGYNILRTSNQSTKKKKISNTTSTGTGKSPDPGNAPNSSSNSSTTVEEQVVNNINISNINQKNNILLVSKNGVICKKLLTNKPCLKHHKPKKFWTNIPPNDLLVYSKLL